MPSFKPMSLMSQNKSVMGYHLGRLKGAEHKIKAAISGIESIIEKGHLSPVIGKIFPFEQIRYVKNI